MLLQQRFLSRFSVSTVDESAPSFLAQNTGTVSPSQPSILGTGKEQSEIKDMGKEGTSGGVEATITKRSEDESHRQSFVSLQSQLSTSIERNLSDLSQMTEQQGTQSEISMSSSTDVYSSKRSSIIDQDGQLGPLEMDPLGQSAMVEDVNLDQGIKSAGILQIVQDSQISDASGSEGPSRKTSVVSDRATGPSQFTPENTVTPAMFATADPSLSHPKLSQQNSLEKDR